MPVFEIKPKSLIGTFAFKAFLIALTFVMAITIQQKLGEHISVDSKEVKRSIEWRGVAVSFTTLFICYLLIGILLYWLFGVGM